jgi:hypothetical protein
VARLVALLALGNIIFLRSGFQRIANFSFMPITDDNLNPIDELPPAVGSAPRPKPRAVPASLSQQVRAKRRRNSQGGLAVVPTTAADVSALTLIDLPAVSQELQVHRNLIQALAEEMLRARNEQETNLALLQESRDVIDTLRQKIVSLEVHRDNQAAQAKNGELDTLRAAQARQAGQLAHLKQELEASRVQRAHPWWRRLFPRR